MHIDGYTSMHVYKIQCTQYAKCLRSFVAPTHKNQFTEDQINPKETVL